MVFNRSDGMVDRPVQVPCGQCIGCRLDKARDWAIRCMHEAQLSLNNCFVTLTYETAPRECGCSKAGIHGAGLDTLRPVDFQLFMKRLRKARYDSWLKVRTPGELFIGPRYLQAGEYGDLGRPHHHALIFGTTFPDMTPWEKRGVHTLFRSSELESLWPHGFSSVGELTYESASYVARYTLKKLTGQLSGQAVGRHPEFSTMSLKPGIGAAWFYRFGAEAYPSDEVTLRGGSKMKPPRYYDRLLERSKPRRHVFIKGRRQLAAEANPIDSARQRARETIERARANLYARKGPS